MGQTEERDRNDKGTIIREDMQNKWTGRSRDSNETETIQ